MTAYNEELLAELSARYDRVPNVGVRKNLS